MGLYDFWVDLWTVKSESKWWSKDSSSTHTLFWSTLITCMLLEQTCTWGLVFPLHFLMLISTSTKAVNMVRAPTHEYNTMPDKKNKVLATVCNNRVIDTVETYLPCFPVVLHYVVFLSNEAQHLIYLNIYKDYMFSSYLVNCLRWCLFEMSLRLSWWHSHMTMWK